VAIAFRASSFAWNSGDAVASINVTIPAAVAVGDAMKLTFCWSGGSNRAASTPSGWSPAGSQNNGTNFGMASFVRIAQAGDVGGSTVVACAITGGTATILGGMVAYSGVDGTTPQDATAVGGSNGFGTSQDSPSITTVTDQAVVVSSVGHRRVSTFTPIDPTDRSGGGVSVNVASVDLSLAIGDYLVTPAGASGVMDWTASGSENGAGISIALRPSSGVTTTLTATPITIAIAQTTTLTATPVTIAIANTVTLTATPVTVAIADTVSLTATPITISIVDVATTTLTASPVTIAIKETITLTATPITIAIANVGTLTASPVTIAVSQTNTLTATNVTISISTPITLTATPITIAIAATETLTATNVTIAIGQTGTLTASPITISISDGAQTPRRGRVGGRSENDATMVVGRNTRRGRMGGRV
jgi:hypothetical protein